MRINESTGARPALAPEVFESCLRSFEPPEADEPAVRFAPDAHELEAWIEEHVSSKIGRAG